MLKTYLIDGDKGGVGKSLAARALVDYFLDMPDDRRPLIAVYDADMSNPDVCGDGGLSTENTDLLRATIVDLSIEYGWIQFATDIADIVSQTAAARDIRVIVNMPAQIGPRAFRGAMPLVSEVLREANAMPVWMLSRTDESIRTLEERVRAMPTRFAAGLAMRNIFFGPTEKFRRWHDSPLRARLVGEGNWIERDFPEINDEVISHIGRTPFHVALEQGVGGKPLAHGYRLVLATWLRTAAAAFADLETIEFPDA